jgi:hypothetical protein
LAKSELESEKALTEQYKGKAELLQRDIEALRSENAEYRSWLGQTKGAIPAIAQRISELKTKIATLEAEDERLRASSPSPLTVTAEHSASLGRAFIDDSTGLIFTVNRTTPDRIAQLTIRTPDQAVPIEGKFGPGQQFEFKGSDRTYQLTIIEVSFLTDSVVFRITPK